MFVKKAPRPSSNVKCEGTTLHSMFPPHLKGAVVGFSCRIWHGPESRINLASLENQTGNRGARLHKIDPLLATLRDFNDRRMKTEPVVWLGLSNSGKDEWLETAVE